MTAEDEKIIGQFLILYPLIGAILFLGVAEVIRTNWRRILMALAVPVAAWKRNRQRNRPRGWTPQAPWHSERLIARTLTRTPIPPMDLMTSEDIVTKFIERKKSERRDAEKR